ncbi:MAG: acyltransferase [Lachnospiraceae bacterium]|nr:acyltransferase [Lachnospiraceae bacterium]
MAKKYYPELDKLRGVAILMVLLYHSILVYPVDLTQNMWCKYLHSFLWMAEMPLFFLISGFCFQYRGQYGTYLLGKIQRILIPHLVFGAADTLIRVMPNPFVHRTVDWQGALKEFFLDGANDWFLLSLFTVFLIAPLGAKLLQQKGGTAILFTLALLLFLGYRYVPAMFSFRNSSTFNLYFVIGMILRKKKENGLSARVGFMLPAFLIGAAGFYLHMNQHWMVYLGAKLFADVTIGYVLRLVLELVTSISICYVLYCLVIWFQGRSRIVDHFFTFCGKYSLQMYLLDGYALVVTRILLIRVMRVEAPLLIILGNFVADTAIVLAVTYWILRRFKLTRVLCGLKS